MLRTNSDKRLDEFKKNELDQALKIIDKVCADFK